MEISRRPVVVAFVCILVASPAGLWARTWKSADGKFTVEADLVEVVGTEVKLKTAMGKEISVPLSKLSTADRLFALEEKKKAEKKPAVKPGDTPPPACGKEPELAPLSFKFGEKEYEMDAPVGTAVTPDSGFPIVMLTLRGDERMLQITPHNANDVKNFQKDFVEPSQQMGAAKTLVEDETTFAYVTNLKAIENGSVVGLAVVTVGDRKLTCKHTNIAYDGWKAEDILLFLRCAKTLREKAP